MRTLTMLNPKEKNIVFGSIQFNLEIWIELTWIQYELNQMYLNSIQVALCKFIQY
jgi:hypothetical protein